MSKSIIQSDKSYCYLCGSRHWIEEHHVFGGPERKHSEHDGLKVYLCHYCHNEPPSGVHQNAERRHALQAEVQSIAMKYYGWSVDDFRVRYRKNYT